jgi:hypothetical protein
LVGRAISHYALALGIASDAMVVVVVVETVLAVVH